MKTGNRCGHDSRRPCLNAAVTIRKGKGGLPRILSLAAERAKLWYRHPRKCPALGVAGKRVRRSERREAYQRVIEAVLYHLDLASMCCGSPTLNNGFVDVSMAALVKSSGMSQRRCERAIADLVSAGFMKVEQPRCINDQGEYVGLRAIRVVTVLFFEYLGLGDMLARERRRATARLQRKAASANKSLSNLMERLKGKMMRSPRRHRKLPDAEMFEQRRAWGMRWGDFIKAGVDPPEAQRLTNLALGFPPDFSPGQLA